VIQGIALNTVFHLNPKVGRYSPPLDFHWRWDVIPITIPTSRDYIGERPRMQIDEDGCASITTGWSKIVRYAKLKEDNICMFCFYNGGPRMGCFLKNLEK
jgi:hypothetical protein